MCVSACTVARYPRVACRLVHTRTPVLYVCVYMNVCTDLSLRELVCVCARLNLSGVHVYVYIRMGMRAPACEHNCVPACRCIPVRVARGMLSSFGAPAILLRLVLCIRTGSSSVWLCVCVYVCVCKGAETMPTAAAAGGPLIRHSMNGTLHSSENSSGVSVRLSNTSRKRNLYSVYLLALKS